MSLRILIADDHPAFASGLAALIEREPDLEAVGWARDGREAVTSAARLEPDLVVMAISMPVLSGLEATRHITAEWPQIKVLCLSLHRERQYLSAALDAGAAGYLLKDRAPEELIAALHCVVSGETFVCPELAASGPRHGGIE